jgi:hypothetical protein
MTLAAITRNTGSHRTLKRAGRLSHARQNLCGVGKARAFPDERGPHLPPFTGK